MAAAMGEGMSERELALWLLGRIEESDAVLERIRASRRASRPEMLDDPDLVAHLRRQVSHLFQGGDETTEELPAALAGLMEGLGARDALSSREELLEKALAAYLERNSHEATAPPEDWRTTVALARAEVEGEKTGAFREGFVADLAATARAELARLAEISPERDRRKGEHER